MKKAFFTLLLLLILQFSAQAQNLIIKGRVRCLNQHTQSTKGAENIIVVPTFKPSRSAITATNPSGYFEFNTGMPLSQLQDKQVNIYIVSGCGQCKDIVKRVFVSEDQDRQNRDDAKSYVTIRNWVVSKNCSDIELASHKADSVLQVIQQQPEQAMRELTNATAITGTPALLNLLTTLTTVLVPVPPATGIAVSAVVFGFMQSYATLNGEKFNTKYKLTGPIVGVVLTVAGGFYLPKTDAAEKIVTIRVFDKNAQPVKNGDVKIYLQEYIRTQSIDNMGQAQFSGVPQSSLKNKIKVEVSSPGYTSQVFDTVLNNAGVLELTMPLQAVVIIAGQVKRANETPIADVEINADGTRYVAYSITNGSYRLRLEEYTLGDEVLLTTSHPGFEDKTRLLKISAPEMKEIDFVLQPISRTDE